jgi:poly-gamma-glutamate synthase PgsB/CapB
MVGGEILLLITGLFAVLGVRESLQLRKALSGIPTRIHVNGTRGKSSVTRLIAGGLREGGLITCAKTTGTLARMILPDGSEYPIFRPGGPRLIEQARVVSVAAAYGAQAVVIECMALQPLLQWMSESRLVKATHGVITNARADHLDVMGPEENDVALALAGIIPVQGKLYTSEQRHLKTFREAVRDRRAQLISVGQEEIEAVTDEEMSLFSHVEHKANVALSLRVCRDLGMDRETALKGMWKARPDPGATTLSHIRFFGRHIFFVNGFSANDPESTQEVWEMAMRRFPDVEKRIAIFNCRADRPSRSQQFGEACVRWQPADWYLLIGTGTYFFARAAISRGLSSKNILHAENRTDSDIFETIIELAGRSCIVVGMANIKGQGLSLVRFFRNRAILEPR